MNNEAFSVTSQSPSALSGQVNAGAIPRQPPIHLTPREAEVVRYVMLGESNKQIARRLGISNYTVRDHVSNLLKKSGVTSRSRLALVIPVPPPTPPARAARPEPIHPVSIAQRPVSHSLNEPSLGTQRSGLPWRK